MKKTKLPRHHFRMYEAATYYQNDGKKVMPHSTNVFSVRQSCCILFSPADNPMDWIYSKTLEYPTIWMYVYIYIYIRYVYYITYIFIVIFKSRHALDFHPSWMQGSISYNSQQKAIRTRSKSFFGYPKIQIHKKWDTKTRCKPGTLSNQFKMDALCNNRFSCEDSKSI